MKANLPSAQSMEGLFVGYNSQLALDRISDEFDLVERQIGGLLALPETVDIKLVDLKHTRKGVTHGFQKKGKIYLANSVVRSLCSGDVEGVELFKGVLAHEISHLSDDFTGNQCGRMLTRLRQFVGEGKAQLVGEYVSGDRIFYASDGLTRAETEIIYPWLPQHLSKLPKWAHLPERHDTDKRKAMNILTLPNIEYMLGRQIVLDAIEHSGADIFEIHTESPRSIFETALQFRSAGINIGSDIS